VFLKISVRHQGCVLYALATMSRDSSSNPPAFLLVFAALTTFFCHDHAARGAASYAAFQKTTNLAVLGNRYRCDTGCNMNQLKPKLPMPW